MKQPTPLSRRALLLGSFLFSLGAGSVWAHDMAGQSHDWHEHMQERCKAEPQKCEEMKKRIEAEREACKQDPEACKQKREEIRQKMAECCKAEPKKCEEWKKEHPRHHDGKDGMPPPASK